MPKQTRFLVWLLEQEKSQDLIGDLARDVRTDKKLPSPLTPEALLDHVETLGGCDGVISAVREAAREFGTPLPEADEDEDPD